MSYKVHYEILRGFLTENACYCKGQKRTRTEGIVRHDTGAGNKYLKRYINTLPEILGKSGSNHWNQLGIPKCVHFMIGLDKNDEVRIVQTLPMPMRCWGCASGPKGSYNNSHIQYEILDDKYKDKDYYSAIIKAARWLDAYIAKEYGLKYTDLVNHAEAHKRGYASNHADTGTWDKAMGNSMSRERQALKRALERKTEGPGDTEQSGARYVVNSNSGLNVREGAGTKHRVIAVLPDKAEVIFLGTTTQVGSATWYCISKPSIGVDSGWVNASYLVEKTKKS